MKDVRFGIVGIGNMGSGHLTSFKNGLIRGGVLTAVCDIRPERLEWAKAQTPSLKTFDNLEAMLNSGEIDALIIAVPHYFHPPMAIEAFKHKIHVMTEKPAGVYTRQVREMNEAAAKAEADGVVFGLMYNVRTSSVFKKMREMVMNGDIGEMRRCNWIITSWYRPQSYYNSGGWRATWSGEGGGVLMNQCPHNLDIWQWICGMPVKVRAFCHEGYHRDIEVENDVTAYVEYENGASGVFVTSTSEAPGTDRFEIVGDKGKLICLDGKLTFYRLKVPEPVFNAQTTESFPNPEYDVTEIETDGAYPQHPGVLNAMIEKINGQGELIARGEEGIRGLTICNAIYLSAWKDKTVTLPLDEDEYFEALQEKVRGSKAKTTVQEADTDMAKSFYKG
ncbi:MAG: Gfo/Idh/MocA family oxidoreductase [Defluviitaleaceae bacterium]|nr:Gfo/Idh/MocA family oxidoreductase [Defluviitaleaceae bacterium]